MLANHFGTFAESELKAQAVASGNTSSEQLMCLGYNPQKKRLDAVIHIKLDGGYNGGLCTPGRGYVKFFASTDGGATWTNLGTTSFTVWDVPGVKPLEYDATLHVDLAEECCREENLVLIRGILSWEVPPGGPNDPVVWGNALDAMIQVEPRQGGEFIDLFACLDLKVAFDELVELVDARADDHVRRTEGAEPVELHETYKATDVPPHRYLLSHVSDLLAAPALLTEKLSQPDFKLFPGIEIDFSKLIKYVIDPQGNAAYEQIGWVQQGGYASESSRRSTSSSRAATPAGSARTAAVSTSSSRSTGRRLGLRRHDGRQRPRHQVDAEGRARVLGRPPVPAALHPQAALRGRTG